MRGNPQLGRLGQRLPRSIPARAGEPPPSSSRGSRAAVYPRACGGTYRPTRGSASLHGLSPRVRGNRSDGLVLRLEARSIPARAGEPASRSRRSFTFWVYPRACGGTPDRSGRQCWVSGLSPRVRGNHVGGDQVAGGRGSIPARAGEPPSRRLTSIPPTVYPRACGGTVIHAAVVYSSHGLSPRVRGNLLAARRGRRRDRSIPARAGEPRTVAG